MNTLINGERLDTIWHSYGIPKKFIESRFNNYYPRNKDQKEAVNECQEYAKQDIKKYYRGKGLFLHCPITGTGKTHLAVATVHKIVAANTDKFGYKGKISEFPTLEEIEASRYYNGIYVGFVNVTDLLTTSKTAIPGMIVHSKGQQI